MSVENDKQLSPAPKTDGTGIFWLLLTGGAILLGTMLLSQAVDLGAGKGSPPWLAVLALLFGALALWQGRHVVALAEADPEAESARQPSWLAAHITAVPMLEANGRLLALLGAIGLTLFGLWRLPKLTGEDSYTIVTITWLLAIGLYLWAVAPPRGESRNWGDWLRGNWIAVSAVVGILLLAFVLRYWHISQIPFTLGGDEGSQGLEAVHVLDKTLRNPFSTGWLGVPSMSFFFQSLTVGPLGQTIYALRLPWVLVGTATVLFAFWLVRRLFNTPLALMTVLLLAVYHYHIHYSRLGSNQIADPFFLTLALLFLYRAIDRKNSLDWALAGSVAGLAFYFYAGARLTPVIITAVLGYLFILGPRRFWDEHRMGIAVMVGAFLIVGLPMFQHGVRFPGEFNARLNEVGIIQSGWLEREIDIRGDSAPVILWDQFQRAALAFNYYPDRVVWYGLKTPLLNPLFGAVFLLGLIYSTLQLFDRKRGPRVAPMVAWWWGGMLLGGMMTESPPSSQRLITLSVPTCFFIAYASWEILRLAQQVFNAKMSTVYGSMAVISAVFAIYSLQTYFIDYTPQRIYGGQNAELATEIAPTLNALKRNHRFQFVGAPWMYWGFATLPYLVTNADAGDVAEPILDAASAETLLPPDKGAVFIVIPPRQQELALIQSAFPEGELREFFSPVDDRLMVSLYVVEQE